MLSDVVQALTNKKKTIRSNYFFVGSTTPNNKPAWVVFGVVRAVHVLLVVHWRSSRNRREDADEHRIGLDHERIWRVRRDDVDAALREHRAVRVRLDHDVATDDVYGLFPWIRDVLRHEASRGLESRDLHTAVVVGGEDDPIRVGVVSDVSREVLLVVSFGNDRHGISLLSRTLRLLCIYTKKVNLSTI